MEMIIFVLVLGLIGLFAVDCGADTRTSEHDHARNW
jgi:hypothetical protein